MTEPALTQDNPDLDAAAYPALILAAHGSQRHPGAIDHIVRLGEKVQLSGEFSAVHTVFQMGGPSPASLKGKLTGSAFTIVPYMMTDGFLAASLAGAAQDAVLVDAPNARVTVAKAVGTHPMIAAIAADLAASAFRREGIDAADGQVMLVAHGSQNHPASRLAAEVQLSRLQATRKFASVTLGLLEEAPFAADVLSRLARPVAVVGLFAAPGGHALDDIDEIVHAAGVIDVIDGGFVGQDSRMATIIADRAREIGNSQGPK